MSYQDKENPIRDRTHKILFIVLKFQEIADYPKAHNGGTFSKIQLTNKVSRNSEDSSNKYAGVTRINLVKKRKIKPFDLSQMTEQRSPDLTEL